MNNNENDEAGQVHNEELLRFLDAGPRRLRGSESKAARKSAETQADFSSCPAAESYVGLATGAVQGDKAEELLSHAADCDACGNLLAISLGALDVNPSAEELAAISELTSRTDWQGKLARELAATKARKPSIFLDVRRSVWGMGALGIAAALLIAAGAVLWQRQNHTPERQLAMAYEQSRTLELRVPDAGYSTLTSGDHTRGEAADHEPPPLLDARARLTRELQKSPQDAHWLELQARADVLEERYDSAIDVLDRLIAQGPVTAELLTDAASAYYQRGLVSGNELDRSTSLDYLRRADQLAPADPVVLFNEAIVMEDRGQMMNAVEVWNRYVTVERDPNWSAEGKRKLAALEQTLNRLKSHQSRIEQMLAAPAAMDELATNPKELTSLDEELATYELDKLLLNAYPSMSSSLNGRKLDNSQQARGSPCSESCLSARRLLQAIASSLKTRHKDDWLSDLISPRIDSLPAVTADHFTQALRFLALAIREELTGEPTESAKLAQQSQALFRQVKQPEMSSPTVEMAARVGEQRAAVEHMLALQLNEDFLGCRAVAEEIHTKVRERGGIDRYPWIEAQTGVTEKVCDDTPETRTFGRQQALSALRLAEEDSYLLLTSRIQIILAQEPLDSGDYETGERLVLSSLRNLYAADPPPLRIANTIAALSEIEESSPFAWTNEGAMRESPRWFELGHNNLKAAVGRMGLGVSEMRLGKMKEAEEQIRIAHREGDPGQSGSAQGANFTESELLLASSMLEHGTLRQAAVNLDLAEANLRKKSDTWLLRQYVAERGQLELAQGHLDQAAGILESNIRSSEGKDVHGGDRETAAEFAELDHDLYAELAATWLAQGRSADSVLALWERFRLRSRGLPITQCREDALDCDEPDLLAAMRNLGDASLLTGQILLADRVLVYRVSKDGVNWSSRPHQRRDVLDTAATLERAVSSPVTSTETAEQLGASLSDALLPLLPGTLSAGGLLILEPDPELQNLPWPVLPVSTQPLGLAYPLAEMRSLLAVTSTRQSNPKSNSGSGGALVIGASRAADGEPPLLDALQEAKSVSGYLHAPQLLLGQQATTARVAQTIESATVFHFAGHALQTSNGTELLLAPTFPGEAAPWLDGKFLRQHPPRACRLAVLSACATGTREAYWNHPLQDIVETLGSLGVPEVVATRWQINSEEAVPFMETFYRGIAQGDNVAVALTSARRVQFGQSPYNKPYYWAAYYLSCTEKVHPRKSVL
jgi:CHAT domain-containing protein